MEVKIMTTEAIEYVKENIENLTHYYVKGEDPSKWLKRETGKDAFVKVEGLEFEDFELINSIDGTKESNNDIINIKTLYNNMIDLNESFATDERLWAGLSHTYFYQYLRKRWDDYSPKALLNHYFFNGSKPRCLSGKYFS